MIGHMPSKHEALGSSCSNARKTKREKEREIERNDSHIIKHNSQHWQYIGFSLDG
jgi:hypothetical protein